MALDNNGNAIETDGDGIPDYLEDPNGNGTVDSGETDWLSASDRATNSVDVIRVITPAQTFAREDDNIILMYTLPTKSR